MALRFHIFKSPKKKPSISGKRKFYETFGKNIYVKKPYIHADFFKTNIGFNTNIGHGIDIRDTWRY